MACGLPLEPLAPGVGYLLEWVLFGMAGGVPPCYGLVHGYCICFSLDGCSLCFISGVDCTYATGSRSPFLCLMVVLDPQGQPWQCIDMHGGSLLAVSLPLGLGHLLVSFGGVQPQCCLLR